MKIQKTKMKKLWKWKPYNIYGIQSLGSKMGWILEGGNLGVGGLGASSVSHQSFDFFLKLGKGAIVVGQVSGLGWGGSRVVKVVVRGGW